MITYNEAVKIIDKFVPSKEVVEIDLDDALNYVVAEDIYSNENNPPFDNSKMDGYAVIHTDTIGTSIDKPVRLKVIDYIYAGNKSNEVVKSGFAMKIMTGAPIPKGATGVIKIEDTTFEKSEISILSKISEGNYIRRLGEDIRAGEIVIEKNTHLTPYEIGVLSAIGKNKIQVYKKPRIAFFSTGDELISDSIKTNEYQIRNVNSNLIKSLLKSIDVDYIDLGIAHDNLIEIKNKLNKCMQYDGVIVTGGASVGDKDFVKKIVEEKADSILFSKVAVKPGKPITIGLIENKPIFALPGNPMSAALEFEIFVKPTLLKMKGIENKKRPVVNATALSNYISDYDNRVNVIYTNLFYKDGKYHADFKEKIKSGNIGDTVNINGIIILEKNTEIKKGEFIEVELLNNKYNIL